MGKFAVRVSLFMLPLLVLLGVIEYVDRGYSGPLRYKAEYVERHGPEITTLVLGPSTTYDGIDPSLLGPGAFSFAFNSQTLDYDLAVLEKFGPMMPNLRRVIVNVGYISLRQPDLEDDAENFLAIDYYHQAGLRVHGPLSRHAWYLSNPFVASKRFKMTLTGEKDPIVCDSLGLSLRFPYRAGNREWIAHCRQDAQAHSYKRTNPNALSALLGIAAWCRARNVQIVMVTLPLYGDYLAATRPQQWAEIRSAVSEVLAADPSAVYLNFSDAPGFGPDDFSDGSHLNYDRGAPKFTRLLRDSLDRR